MRIKHGNIKNILFSWVLMLTLVGVYVVKDFHLNSHCSLSEEHCEGTADSQEDKHDCPICHFYFDPFIHSDLLTVEFSITTLPLQQVFFIENITVEKHFSGYLRAPPSLS